MFLVLSIVLFLLSPYSGAENGDEFCPPTRCFPNGPEIRYPFRLKTQPLFCGREGFELSCSNNKTLLHLPSSGDYYVQDIDYFVGDIAIMDVRETACALQSLLFPNLINSRFYESPDLDECTIFNCTERIQISSNYYSVVGPINCISYDRNFVYLISSDTYSKEILPPNCSKYKTVRASIAWELPDSTKGALTNPGISIRWKPHKECDKCELSGDYCGFNTTSDSVMCCKYENPKFCSNYHRKLSLRNFEAP
ncbi:hypothetical protein Pint_22121 [Pistacia integerrima]|uniref:Uncharacterized protein n=1 Tax=Pistacia integerrima TaxID=434235 RepID=A0ACC0YKT7_9ROSI|nr:hypothetical protein Pint_22121 [Pistacia integerrima]